MVACRTKKCATLPIVVLSVLGVSQGIFFLSLLYEGIEQSYSGAPTPKYVRITPVLIVTVSQLIVLIIQAAAEIGLIILAIVYVVRSGICGCCTNPDDDDDDDEETEETECDAYAEVTPLPGNTKAISTPGTATIDAPVELDIVAMS